jgi:pyridoxamine 5'-phosphate oxidase
MLKNTDLSALRVNYTLKSFSEQDVLPDPFKQFENWLDEAIQSDVNEPNAMVLATVKEDLSPSARVVLLKGFSHDGFVFYTNYESNKSEQISKNNQVALVFCWLELQRQVRIEGTVSRISEDESDQYFHSRPLSSQIGAHASPQSQLVESREELERKYREFEELFMKQPIIRPKNWGGFIVKPKSFEFWQGRESRMHDRFLYNESNLNWQINRLAP